MKSKVLLASLVGGILVISGAVGAVAATENPPEGGTWNYGVSSNVYTRAYSKYFHPSRCHGSSVYRNGSLIVRSIQTAPNYWSLAEKNKAPWTGGFSFTYWLC